MAALADSLRRQLEKVVVEAREVGETGARAAFERLAVDRREPFGEMTPAERELRVRLRAHARQLGDLRKENGEQEIAHLVSECAYEHWHRMLFARFLAENRLLIHPDHGIPVTLAECEELAAEGGEGDGWTLAGRFASRMLPAIFRPEDPVLAVRLAPEHQQALEKLLAGLAAEVFTADDSLGWVYQFWQTKRKKEVNESGKKIGADELPAVTQLFTEPYMVQFLLHNTLGAWWAGKILAAKPDLALTAASEEEIRKACALPGYEWTYLRFVRPEEGDVWRPAAGAFEGWPERAAELTVLDPCCGSGHFLVEAFRILVPMRMEEEKLSAPEAAGAVLKDNLFGLEIDERCTQIAAFNLALTAWTYPNAGGHRALPELNIACSGLAVGAKEEEWLKLAGKDKRLREGMRRLYRLFKDAPILGSLIDPRREEAELFKAGFDELEPLLEQALANEEVKRDVQATEVGITAHGMARAAYLLAGSYTLVATNVPYLGRGAQPEPLKEFADEHHIEAKADLATVFLSRTFGWLWRIGTVAVVAPQNWLFLAGARKLREKLLTRRQWNLVVRLGEHAFESPSAAGAFAAMVIITSLSPKAGWVICGIDVSSPRGQPPILARDKAALLGGRQPAETLMASQEEQLRNPGARVIFGAMASLRDPAASTLADCCSALAGALAGDLPRFSVCFWEVPASIVGQEWELYQTAPRRHDPYSGREAVVFWQHERGEMFRHVQSVKHLNHVAQNWLRGKPNWGKHGVALGLMSEIPATLYTGEIYDCACCALVPEDPQDLPAIWEYCQSREFSRQLRILHPGIAVTPKTILEVPFDPTLWKKVAEEKYPNGLPEPASDDPTQWLFHGRPGASNSPLQVAIARLLGYRWPPELDKEIRLSDRARELVQHCDQLLDIADDDGIVCIPPVSGEQPAGDRLQKMLAAAFGEAWSSAALSALLDDAGFSGRTLGDWLSDGFFEQHCQLFHQRPFVWHIWDGRKRDGFAALVNYHKLDRKTLERLTYAVLGDWIAGQRSGVKAGERGADERLAAAETLQQKLALILEGEPPYDIFVRWKPLHEQPIGWEPDLNDGVRINIRPFVEAGVLRKDPKIKWMKDRGAEPESLRPKKDFPWFWKGDQFTGERVNDVHLTNAEKRAARERAHEKNSV